MHELVVPNELASKAFDATRTKAKLLTQGVNVIDTTGDFKPQIVGLYNHNIAGKPVNVPQEVIIDQLPHTDGPFIANIRYNPNSPLTLVSSETGLELHTEDGNIPVTLPEKPPFYDLPLADGRQVGKVAQKLGSDGAGVVPNNSCSYFGGHMECRFCEIVPSYKDARTNPSAKKKVETMQEALTTAVTTDPTIKYIFITTGNDRTYDETYHTYRELLEPISPLLKEKGVTTFGVLMPPDDLSLIDMVYNTGLDSVTFNLEVWNTELAKLMTPGKMRYGRDRMLKALEYARDVFPQGNTLSNLVYGIQSYDFSPDWKFDPDREAEAAYEGAAELLKRGIVPTHTIYHTSGKNPIGPIRLDPDKTLKYHMAYANMAYKSGVIPKERPALFGGLGTVSNSLFNDAFTTVRLQHE